MNVSPGNSSSLNFNIGLGRRLVLFLCATIFCFIIAGAITGFFIHFKGVSTLTMRISAVIQDVIAFIAPALITAILITRLPARFLALEHKPELKVTLLACLVLIVSIPAMNALVAWNESISLPDSMSQLENWMRASENSAQDSINILLGGNTLGSLIVSILIVGVFAGFSEEIFFRGAFQRLLSTGGLNIHASIWLVAFIFSASHLQFYGFFGRFILGAYFGYLLYWTKSLWIPVIIHIVNNTLFIIGNYSISGMTDSGINEFNTFGFDNYPLVILSCVLVIVGMVFLRKATLKDL